MFRQLILHSLVKQELTRYQKLQKKLQKRLKRLPKGSITLRNGRFYHFYRENGTQHSVRIDEKSSLADAIKQRKYISKGLSVLDKRIQQCSNFLKSEEFYDLAALENQLPPQYHGVDKLDIWLDDLNLSEWLESGHQNTVPVTDEHFTLNGMICRSKSEAMIGTCLEQHGLLYIVEPEVQLIHKKVYPDFAIMLPLSRRIIYWEHFGKIDDPAYSVKNFPKPGEYAQCGIHLGINFFYTFETKENPLNIKTINAKIDEFLALDRELASNTN